MPEEKRIRELLRPCLRVTRENVNHVPAMAKSVLRLLLLIIGRSWEVLFCARG